MTDRAVKDDGIELVRGSGNVFRDLGMLDPNTLQAKAILAALHPGNVIRAEIVTRLNLSVGQAAEALGVLRPSLSAVLNGRASLSPEMALRIEKAFGLSMDALMQKQAAYDVAQMRSRAAEIDVQRFEPERREPPRQGSML